MNSILIPAIIAIIPLIAIGVAAYLFNKEEFKLKFSPEPAIPKERYQVPKFTIPRPTIDFHARVYNDEDHTSFSEGLLRVEAETLQFICNDSRFPVWTYSYSNMQARKPGQAELTYNIELEVDENLHQMWVGDENNQAREFLLAIATHGVGPTPRPQLPEVSKQAMEPELQKLLNELASKDEQEKQALSKASADLIADDIIDEEIAEANDEAPAKAKGRQKKPKEAKSKLFKREKKEPVKSTVDLVKVPKAVPTIAPELSDDDDIFLPGEEALMLGEKFDGSWESFKKTAQEVEDEESLLAYHRELASLEDDNAEPDLPLILPLATVEAEASKGKPLNDELDGGEPAAETRVLTEEDLGFLEPHEKALLEDLGDIVVPVENAPSPFLIDNRNPELIDELPRVEEAIVEVRPEELIVPVKPIESYDSDLMANEPVLTIDDYNIDLASFQAARKRADQHMASEVQGGVVEVAPEDLQPEAAIDEGLAKSIAGKRAARGKRTKDENEKPEQKARNKAVAGKRKASKK